ncbi:hypothetical protein [Collinsella phocaeensis]|uniref:hypothetical protein n=1 Tax=Collinsella phocaeensis TaxID=1871016 RepID=UPI00117F311C|nr:hypothetical protein [Collinsella phocaeensis]
MVRTKMFDGEISRWTNPLAYEFETGEQAEQVAAEARGDKRGQPSVLVDGKHARRLGERHALDPFHDDRRGSLDLREAEQLGKTLEPRQGLVLRAERRARKLAARGVRGVVFGLRPLGHDERLERTGLPHRVGSARHGAQAAAARSRVIHEQGGESAAVRRALTGLHAERLLEFLQAHQARTAREAVRGRSDRRPVTRQGLVGLLSR